MREYFNDAKDAGPEDALRQEGAVGGLVDSGPLMVLKDLPEEMETRHRHWPQPDHRDTIGICRSGPSMRRAASLPGR